MTDTEVSKDLGQAPDSRMSTTNKYEPGYSRNLEEYAGEKENFHRSGSYSKTRIIADNRESQDPSLNPEKDLDSALSRSKSSVWSVSSATSSIGNSKKTQNDLQPSRNIINSPTSQKTATPKSQVGLIAEITKLNSSGNTDFVVSQDKSLGPSPLTVQPGKSNPEGFNSSRNVYGHETENPLGSFAATSHLHRNTTVVHEELPVHFDDLISEPKGFRTPKFSWNLSHEVFDFTKRCFYTVITLFCAIPFAFVWGVWFSILTCFNVWCCYPFKKSMEVNIACFKAIWNQVISCVCDPLCRSSGLILSSIKVKSEKHDV